MSWHYMNSILKNWHAKGLHKVRDIEAGDTPASAKASSGAKSPAPSQGQREERMARNIAALKRAAGKKTS